MERRIGVVTGGSLTDGLDVRLHDGVSVEELRAGQMVAIDGEKWKFYGMITDLQLRSTEPEMHQDPPDPEERLSREVLKGTVTFCALKVRLMLSSLLNGDECSPVQT
ncbi:MAG: ATPase, partial [Armatimonadetes bacterium]|nr:ATPase [Armatimonadota bacterium]MDW8123119.1 HAS-barrel domain-containing protein [Armatimonadota bacterium]